jgi:hypothetical protein
MARKKASKRWVETGPMAPWMRLYVQWLVSQPGAELSGSRGSYRSRYPTAAERAARASFLAKRVVQGELVRLLERRKDVREYFEKVGSDVDYHTKELAKQEVAENFEIRRAGLHKAAGRTVAEDGTVSYDVADLKAIEHYTRPFVERGIGKKVEHDQDKAPRVVINLLGAPEASKRLWLAAVSDEPEETLDYEVIPNEKLLTDGDDD